MKLPFTIGLSTVYRILLPGAVASLFFFPLAYILSRAVGLGDGVLEYFTVATIALGWIISSLDYPIYMLLEGRRWWPQLVFKLFVKRQRRKLYKLTRRYRKASQNKDSRLATELALQIARLYPLLPNGRRAAIYPTRLGNMLAEFETYPDRKYGLDGIFYWNRIYITLDKDLRDFLNQQQATADCSVYLCFIFLCGAVAYLFIGALCLIGGVTFFGRPTDAIVIGSIVTSSLLLFKLSYNGALWTHFQLGNNFKAVFDMHWSKLDMTGPLAAIARLTREPAFEKLAGSEAHKAAWRYLHWHRVRMPGRRRNQNIEIVRALKAHDRSSG